MGLEGSQELCHCRAADLWACLQLQHGPACPKKGRSALLFWLTKAWQPCSTEGCFVLGEPWRVNLSSVSVGTQRWCCFFAQARAEGGLGADEQLCMCTTTGLDRDTVAAAMRTLSNHQHSPNTGMTKSQWSHSLVCLFMTGSHSVAPAAIKLQILSRPDLTVPYPWLLT